MFDKATQALISSIKTIVAQMLNDAEYDKTYIGRVKAVNQVRVGLYTYLYTVTINGLDYSIKSKLKYTVDDYVLVLVPRNNWGSAKLIATGEEKISELKEIALIESRIDKLEQALNALSK